jgi:hypothetical protein
VEHHSPVVVYVSVENETTKRKVRAMTIYKEKFTNEFDMGQGTLQVIRTKKDHAIVAYIGCEYPEVLARGTIEECRSEWTKAKNWIRKQMGIK